MKRPPLKTEPVTAFYGKLCRWIHRTGVVKEGQHVLVAVSGGIDSVVLLDLIVKLASEWNLRVGVLHVNHRLRGKESDEDEKFVRSLARAYRVPCYVTRPDTRKKSQETRRSIQETARDLRYLFFLRKRALLSADAVLTAHTADDNAETMLLNFVRGTGVDGLGGIPVVRRDGNIVRPLLFATRSEIARYARIRKLKFREDSSNRKEIYSRNYLRKTILPALRSRLNPSLQRTLTDAGTIFRNCADFVEAAVRRASAKVVERKGGQILMNIKGLRRRHPYIQQMIARKVLMEQGDEPTFDRICSLVELMGKEKGTTIDCGGQLVAERSAEKIVLRRKDARKSFRYTLKGEGVLHDHHFSISVKKARRLPNKFGRNSSSEYVDAAKTKFPLVIRSWKSGDWFIPLGLHHRKKVSDFFVDAKITRSLKALVPLVESDGNIVWVAGMRIDERFRISPSTTKAYQLNITWHG